MKKLLLASALGLVSFTSACSGWDKSEIVIGEMMLKPLSAELFLNQYGQPNIGFVQLDIDNEKRCNAGGQYLGETRISVDSKETVFPRVYDAKQSCVGDGKVATYISEQDGIDYLLDELDRANGDYRLLVKIHHGKPIEKVVSIPTEGFTTLYYWSIIKEREYFSRYKTELFSS